MSIWWEKIKGAVRTDFILSAEIIAITLGVVAAKPFLTQFVVLGGIGIIMTIGVYGIVAGIVKLDDLGLYLTQKGGASASIGKGILFAAPYLMKGLSVAGTVAMFMVGGGILTHGIPKAHDFIHHLAHSAHAVPGIGGMLESLVPTVLDALFGVIAGMITLGVVMAVQRVMGKKSEAH
jgi:uncharacterized protein